MADERAAALLTGVFEAHVKVVDLERSMRFYEEAVGLERGWTELSRRAAFYWVGGRGRGMLGVWETPPTLIVPQHLAFATELGAIEETIARLSRRGVPLKDFFDTPSTSPTVFGWMPAVSIYFDDPDGHLLEVLAMLPDPPAPELGVVSLADWRTFTTRRNLAAGTGV
ncbi:MAG: VOC family protein [Vicinamibacterales bacterium]